jgi:hypothetical protein
LTRLQTFDNEGLSAIQSSVFHRNEFAVSHTKIPDRDAPAKISCGVNASPENQIQFADAGSPLSKLETGRDG